MATAKTRSGWAPHPLVTALILLVGVGGVGAWVMFQDSGVKIDLPSGDTAQAPDQPPPDINVFIFLVDTLRADRMGCYDYDRRPTSPCVDELADVGVVFEHATAPAPWTIPSVASMFTSTYPCEHQMLSKYDKLPNSYDLLAERLRRIGYQTYSRFGNEFLGPQFGLHQGIFVHLGGGRNGGEKVSQALGPNPPEPFFFYVHNMEPHNPYHYAPPHTPGFDVVSAKVRGAHKYHFDEYKAAAEYDYRRQLPLGTNDKSADQEHHLAKLMELRDSWNELYDASVHLADSRVCTTIDMLKKRGFWDNMVFIFVADHGEEMGEHGAWLHDQSCYDELMRVPFVIRFPNDEFAGQRIKEPVSLMDVMPTIFDYIGRPELIGDSRGRSLMPLIRGEGRRTPAGEYFVPGMRINTTRYYKPWEKTRGDVNIIVRADNWKGIWNVEPDTFELYDIDTDPGEQNDVATDHPQRVEEMRSFAREWYAACQAGQTEDVGELDKETLERLRSLGYIGDEAGAAEEKDDE